MKITHFVVGYNPLARSDHLDWNFDGASQIGACSIQIAGWPHRLVALRHGDDAVVFSAENT